MLVDFVGGILRWPFIAVADYKYNRDPKYKEKADKLDEEKEALEKARVNSSIERMRAALAAAGDPSPDQRLSRRAARLQCGLPAQLPPGPRRRRLEEDARLVQALRRGVGARYLMACVPWVIAAPARSAAATATTSAISCSEVPASRDLLLWISMQYGHCVVRATASAISSLYLAGIAPAASAALWSAQNALTASGALASRVLSLGEVLHVVHGLPLR